jgi:hypothetical protein
MPLRMILDAGAVDPTHVALLGARDLDPPEREFIRDAGIHTGKHAVDHALHEVDCVYDALDFDALDEADVASFMPVVGGIRWTRRSRRSAGWPPRRPFSGRFHRTGPRRAHLEPARGCFGAQAT